MERVGDVIPVALAVYILLVTAAIVAFALSAQIQQAVRRLSRRR